MGFYLGRRSQEMLNSCEKDLQKIASKAIAGPIDFSVIEGYRSPERQEMLFRQGLSLVDGMLVRGKHNYKPSKAFDVVPYPSRLNNVLVWNEPERFYILAGVILSAAKSCNIEIRWGGDWDGDGTTTNQEFHDLGHYELLR